MRKKKQPAMKIYDPEKDIKEIFAEIQKQQPIVKIYDPEKEVKEAIAEIRRQQKIINRAIEAVVVVVAIGFIAMIIAVFDIFIDHQKYAAERYNEYIKLLGEHEQQLETPDQEDLDIKTNEEVEFNQENPKNDMLPDTDNPTSTINGSLNQ